MAQATDSAEELIREHAPEVADQIKKAAQDAWGNEAQFRGNLARGRVFEGFAEHLELVLQPREEYTLINGRADAVYNRFVIEYEPPGSLTARDSQKNRHAVDQVKQYIEDLVKKERHKPERLAGVVTDGCYFIFCRFRAGAWHKEDSLPVTAYSTGRFLASLYLLSTEKALTADNLVRDFGENSNVARIAVSAICKALTESQNPKVKVIYDQWRQQFSEVCGYEEGSPRLDVQALAKQYGVQDPKPSAFRLFFSIHTYYATFIKLLAVQVVHYYVAPKLGTALPQVASYATDRLRKYLRQMERGGIFKDLGIGNFLEGDFFGWYLEVWDNDVDKGIRRILSELANYSLVTLDADPDQTRDLLKKLYQNVMPRQLRHHLGEYYTPDWLAERLLNQLGFTTEHEARLHEKRLLDPACGSGTFLVLAIKRVREHCAERPIKPADLLRKIQNNIMGFDLNPLAVISARTNYLLALGDLLQAQRDFEVNVPVYLCDSILTPSQAEELVEPHVKKPQKGQKQVRMMGAEERLYEFKTVVGDFAIPSSLVKAQYINQLAGMVEECVEGKYTVQDFRKRLLNTFPLVEGKDDLDIQILEQLHAKITDLDERAINGIWARIIKNAFAPLFCGKFDYVAGNPPWVNWANLPDDYRKRTAPLWSRYGLFTHTGLKARLGGAKDDISVLMTYVAADSYLMEQGRLGFVITQTVFKTKGAGVGFRRLRVGDGEPLRVLHVDDMSSLKPFEGAANRTSVVILEKGTPTRFPVPYTWWTKTIEHVGISPEAPIEQVTTLTRRAQWVAMPVDDQVPTSPWITARPKALRGVRKYLGESSYRARSGSCTWANGVYWVSIVAKRPDGYILISNQGDVSPRLRVDSIQGAVEPDLVYPLLRGRDIGKWTSSCTFNILLPADNVTGKTLRVDSMKSQYPKSLSFLQQFETVLRRRSGYTKYFGADAPFYAVYNVGPYTFQPWKVAWAREDISLRASVIPQHTIPDQTSQFVVGDGPEEAHYLCSVLNSSMADFVAKTYSTDITTDIVRVLAIPKFHKLNPIHAELATLSDQAHQAAMKDDKEAVARIEKRIDELAAELWELTREELKEIQESLKELK